MDATSKFTSACFFGYGFLYSIPRVLLFMAAGDIVSGTVIQSSSGLLLFSLADVLFKLFATITFRRVSFIPLLVVAASLWLTAYVLLAMVDQVNLRLASAFLIGGGNGLLNILGMFILARFADNVEAFSSAYQGGMNTATLPIALLYTGKYRRDLPSYC